MGAVVAEDRETIVSNGHNPSPERIKNDLQPHTFSWNNLFLQSTIIIDVLQTGLDVLQRIPMVGALLVPKAVLSTLPNTIPSDLDLSKEVNMLFLRCYLATYVQYQVWIVRIRGQKLIKFL
jgi:hypothetical protein